MADSAEAPTASTTPIIPRSRAVLRPIEAGSYVDCVRCGQRVKFQAKVRLMQVICNVYEGDRWIRVEHFHQACYDEAAAPYGEAA